MDHIQGEGQALVGLTVTNRFFAESCLISSDGHNVGAVMEDESGVSVWDGENLVRFTGSTVNYYGTNGELYAVGSYEPMTWIEPISPNRRKRCEYCGTLHERDYGVCDRCGAPL